MQNVTIIIPTFNSARTINACLESIHNQDYPRQCIEILVTDGGSTDGTLDLLEKFTLKVIHEQTGSPEAAKSIALKHVKSEFIIFLPSDNIIPHSAWLTNMMGICMKESQIVGTYPSIYQWRLQDSLMTRYFALLGANDPIAWFLGKADKKSYNQQKDKEKYHIVCFNEKNLPTIGDNGFIIKKSILNKAQVDQAHFYHIDVCLDLVRLGFNRYAISNDSIIHDTGDRFFDFFKKRFKYMYELYLSNSPTRRYHVYDSKRDRLRLLLFIMYSGTLLGPLLFSIRGMMKKNDIAWMLHPLACNAIIWTYAAALIKYKIVHR